MDTPYTDLSSSTSRLLLVSFWGAICAAIIAAPLLAAHSHPLVASLLYLLFSPVCHQIPERSFALLGHAWAVCHRCAGIHFGVFIASLAGFKILSVPDSSLKRRIRVIAAGAPLILDALLPYTGLWTNTPFSRFFTGFIFGGMLSSLLVLGIAEFLKDALWQRISFRASNDEGNIS